jgi:tetratricopeptide (TPR) repeat protein
VDITSLEQKAIDFARRGDFGADARQVNEELTKLAPDNQGAWTRLARCNIELGLLDAANEALETVLRLNPQNTIARSLLQESIKRQIRALPEAPKPKRAASPRAPRAASKSARTPAAARIRAGFGRPQFAALAQLEPAAAIESVGPQLEAILMALSDRPFAEKVVDARNRAGRAGIKLFRRNSILAEIPGHIYAFHHGGRWEPQFNVGVYAGEQHGRPCLRAGIGFNLSLDGTDPEREDGQERAIEYFERFQRLVSTAWKSLLTDWMKANGGFIQHGADGPATDLLPPDAVTWLITVQQPVEQGWIFVGRWLFADRPDHAEILQDGGALAKWAEGTFVDLLPLWMSVFRDADF